MGRFNFETPKFKEFLTHNVANISQIVSDKTVDSPEFSILKSRYLEKLWIDIGSKEYIICISKQDIIKMDLTTSYEEFRDKVKENIIDNNKCIIDNSLKVITIENVTENLINHCQVLSDTEYCTFLFKNDRIMVFINGKNDFKSNIFYNDKELRSYTSRLDIEYIDQIFDEYEEKCLLDGDQFIYSKDENLLIHGPEEKMKSHLSSFLNSRLAYTFSTKNKLTDSNIVFDISTEVDGKFYFFVIEWLGKSIKDQNNKNSILHDDYYARRSVTKLLEYIKKIEESSTKVECGVLVVYDARKEKTTIDYCDFNFVDNDLTQYVHMFKKYDKLRIC